MTGDETRPQLQGYLWELAEKVVEAPTQEEIDRLVCEGLQSRGSFDTVWVSDTPPDSIPRTVVGRERSEIHRVIDVFEREDKRLPWVRAANENRTIVERLPASTWSGDYTLACVPLTYRRIKYGILVVASQNRPQTGLDQATDILDNFGQIVGHALATTEMQTHGEVFRQAIEQAEPAIAILGEDGTVEYANAGFESIFGYPKSTVIDSSLHAIIEGLPEGIIQEVQTDSPWRDTIVCYRRDGREIHIDLSVAAVPIEGGTRLKYVATGTDITPIREHQQRLQVLNRVLRHNLRNGLDAIRGHIEMAADTARQSSERYLETAMETTQSLLTTAETSRNLQTTLSNAEIREQDLVVVLRRVIGDIGEEYPDQDLQVSMPDTLLISASDGIKDALWELLENACVHGSDPIEVTLEADGGQALIEITDQGQGIPDHELAVIESGEETPLEHGSGLGLWFAHWVIRTSGGQLSFEVDRETSVMITLPAVED